MDNLPVQIILNSTDLQRVYPNKSGGNSVGWINSNTQNIGEFYNIDFKTILGDRYDKYDYYYINLLSLLTSTGTGNPRSTDINGEPIVDNRYYKIYITGLDFINQTTTNQNGVNVNNRAFLGIGIMSFLSNGLTLTSSIRNYPVTDQVVFRKQSRNATIGFYYTLLNETFDTRVSTDSLDVVIYPLNNFYLEIKPVEFEDDNLVKQYT